MAELFQELPLLFVVTAGILGLCIGSFLNVVIYRLPIMMQREWREQCEALFGNGEAEAAAEPERFDLIAPRSACPDCKTPIKPWHNLPLLGYLGLRGRCAACGAKISARYPAIELLTGLLSGLIAWRFGLTLECAGALILTWSLIALTFIDFDTQLLPDIITLPLLWLGLALSLTQSSAGAPLFVTPQTAIIGALAGYLSLWSVYWAFKLLTGKEGMGHGDFKLLAALGAWLGWQMLLLIVILSAVVGLIAAIGMMVLRGHDRQIPIPFGPYLATAGFVALVWGPELMAAYFSASGMQ